MIYGVSKMDCARSAGHQHQRWASECANFHRSVEWNNISFLELDLFGLGKSEARPWNEQDLHMNDVSSLGAFSLFFD